MAFSQHDSDTAATTVISAQNQRWPFVLCSKNISSFVAVWDPEYGMVAFSGTTIFDSRSCLTVESSQKLPTHAVDSLEEAHDDCRTSTFKIYQDVLKDTFRPTLNAPQRFRHNYSKTLASSTHGGLDLYTRDSVLVKDRQSIGPISCLNQLDNDLAFDARLAFSLEQSLEAECDSVCDEGFFDQGSGKDQTTHLKSHFSTTTTSTSNYVEVARFMQDFDGKSMTSTTWSTLEAPDEQSTSYSSINNLRRRLRKRRPLRLQRLCPSPTSGSCATSSNASDKTKYANLIHCLPSLPKFKRESSLDEQWVCVDVTHNITQRLV